MGRRAAGDKLDYAVGLTDFIRLGQSVEADKPLALIHAQTEAQFAEAARMVQAAVKIGDTRPEALPEVYFVASVWLICNKGKSHETYLYSDDGLFRYRRRRRCRQVRRCGRQCPWPYRQGLRLR